jgi:hypothetical protein
VPASSVLRPISSDGTIEVREDVASSKTVAAVLAMASSDRRHAATVEQFQAEEVRAAYAAAAQRANPPSR